MAINTGLFIPWMTSKRSQPLVRSCVVFDVGKLFGEE